MIYNRTCSISNELQTYGWYSWNNIQRLKLVYKVNFLLFSKNGIMELNIK